MPRSFATSFIASFCRFPDRDTSADVPQCPSLPILLCFLLDCFPRQTFNHQNTFALRLFLRVEIARFLQRRFPECLMLLRDFPADRNRTVSKHAKQLLQCLLQTMWCFIDHHRTRLPRQLRKYRLPFFFIHRQNASNANRLVACPDAISALTAAHAPGTGTTLIPAS